MKILKKIDNKIFKTPISNKLASAFLALAIVEILIAYKPITKLFSRDTIDVLMVLEMILTPITVVILFLYLIQKFKGRLSKKAFFYGYLIGLIPVMVELISEITPLSISLINNDSLFEGFITIFTYPTGAIVYALGWTRWNALWVGIPLILLVIFPLFIGILTTVIFSTIKLRQRKK